MIEGCLVDSNIIGINSTNGGSDSVQFCAVKYNHIGIADTINEFNNSGSCYRYNVVESNGYGVVLNQSYNAIYCNRICDNSIYNLRYTLGSNSATFSNNYWCTSDSATIAQSISDGYDDINFGLVNFLPTDTEQCYLGTLITNQIGFLPSEELVMYPNPATEILYFRTRETVLGVSVCDLSGRSYESFFNHNTLRLDKLPRGVYLIRVQTRSNALVSKVIKI